MLTYYLDNRCGLPVCLTSLILRFSNILRFFKFKAKKKFQLFLSLLVLRDKFFLKIILGNELNIFGGIKEMAQLAVCFLCKA